MEAEVRGDGKKNSCKIFMIGFVKNMGMMKNEALLF